jgi:hypothetical protein
MKPSVIYYATAVLLLLFAVGHMLGFTQSDPKWGIDNVIASMRSQRFDISGFDRTYWDFYLAAGLTVAVFYVFAAILAWQLGSLPAETLAQMRLLTWAFAVAFAAVTAVSWLYLFIIPIAFSIAITLCLIAGAWFSSRR